MSEFRDDDLYGIEGPNTGRIQDKLRDPARLKNWWDQYALEAADRLDWLERELAATRDRDEARAEVERLREDAERLTVLCGMVSQWFMSSEDESGEWYITESLRGETFRDAIDAARKE